MEFIQNHYKDIIQIVTVTVTLASLIVRLTPSEKDDAFVMKIVNFLALNKPKTDAVKKN